MGLLTGLYAAYYHYLDNVLMRFCDSISAIPATLLAIALMAVLGAGAGNVVISLSIVFTPGVARIARAAALSVKERTYIEAMRAQGAPPTRILWRHIVPNILGPLIVQGSYIFASAIISEAALSFLGVGVPVPEPSWGNILYEGKGVMYTSLWTVIFPGAFTVLAVLGLNLFGDGLRDVLDPHTT
jgi:peptide/nickel transport system permease protein